MTISLTKKQIKDLNVNGFTVIEKVLDKKSLLFFISDGHY